MFLNGAAFFNYFVSAQCFHEKTLVKWVLNGLEMIREKLNRRVGQCAKSLKVPILS